MRKYLLLTVTSIWLMGCISIFEKPTFYPYERLVDTRNVNVCASLTDSVILYAIFVDVKAYHPWTNFDVTTTTDSIQKAIDWLHSQGKLNNVNFHITPVLHQQQTKIAINEQKVKPKDLTINASLIASKDNKLVRGNQIWADKIASQASKALKLDNTRGETTRNKGENVERLIAKIRQKYKTKQIALMFFVNGYYECEQGASFNTSQTGSAIEYSIVSTQNPSVIAHEFLHLFGAPDLYPAGYTFNYADIAEKYPNEIMLITHKKINKLMISPISKYYIGWQDSLDHANTRLLYHTQNVLEY